MSRLYMSTTLVVILAAVFSLNGIVGDCPKRGLLTSLQGNITMTFDEYPENDYCQWIIRGDGSKFINIHFESFHTECDYDFLYIHDGDSFESPLIGSYSGATIPDEISAPSGSILIQFYSDLNYKPSGGNFQLRYSMTDCKHGCMPCSNRRCVCESGETGLDCSIDECATMFDCNGNSCVQDISDGERYCVCNEGYIGRSCDIDLSGPASAQGQWAEVAPAGVGFESRTGHSAVYESNDKEIWVYGGYSLSTVTDQLKKFVLSTSRWQLVSKSAGAAWPQPSHNHKAVELNGCMYVSGGRNETNFLSQFWRYCFANDTWSQLSDLPEGLTDHTMTLVDDRWLYIFGGLSSDQIISNRLIRFDTLNVSGGLWEEVSVRGGKVSDVSAAGHSAVFHSDSRSLIVFGGEKPYIARFSIHSHDIYAFHVDKQHWSSINYGSSIPNAVPDPIAYHTSSVMGNYMIVYGGRVKRGGGGSCINNRIYAYHLICHDWVDLDDMYASLHVTEPTATPDGKGRYSHTAVVVNGNLLFILGGFRGNVLGDMWSYQVLNSIARNTADTDHGTDYCVHYQIAEGCLSDPECGWCPSPPYSGCTSRANSGLCSKNYVEYTCPGLCNALTDCQSCVVQSHNMTQPTYPQLRQHGPCAWCIHDNVCRSASGLTGTCFLPTPEPIGWWKDGSTTAVDQSQCVSYDNRAAGFRFAVYRSPQNYNIPDSVSSVKKALVIWTENSRDSLDGNSRAYFYIHPNNITDQFIRLKLRVEKANTNITITHNNQQISSAEILPTSTNPATVTLIDSSNPSESVLSNVARGERYLVFIDSWNPADITATTFTYSLQWDAVSGSFAALTKNYLEPFSGGDCLSYLNCLLCQLDVGCGWCPSTDTCYSRSNSSLTSSECGTDEPDHWLITEPSMCNMCTAYIDCQECADSGVCEWSLSKLSCERRGLDTTPGASVSDSALCPTRCNQRGNCSECLADEDECIWCESTQSCDQFAPYLIANSYGQCTAWKEGHQMEGTCTSCEQMTTCSDCLMQSSCGWCGNDFISSLGVCTTGDYSSASNCSSLIHSVLNITAELLSLNISSSLLNQGNIAELSVNASFSYGVCPDVQECTLGLAVCHENSTCVNTAESYECLCNQGFEGDGKVTCNKTCFYECLHGTCNGFPAYECECDLGWTNTTCDIDCGCHNHSTCVNGTGSCDSCQDMTYGDTCEFCLPGSYGNATLAPGCLPCECNGHGVASLDHCNITTGICYCQDGFDGDHCEKCGITSIGDPRDGELCYEYSHHRLVILNATGIHGITSVGKYHKVSYTRWVITPFSDLDTVHNATDVPLMTVSIDTVNTTCLKGYVYVYDGVNTDDSLGYKAAYCGSIDNPHSLLNSVDIYSGYATIVYYGNSTDDEAFTARYVVHECNDSCHGNRACDVNNDCRCIVGSGGIDCEVELCPKNCSGRGYCNQNSQSCFCDDGYSGADCSLESYVTVNRLVEGGMVPVSPSPRQGFTVVNCGLEGFILFGGLSTEDGLLNDIWRYDGLAWQEIISNSSYSPSGRHMHAAVCLNGYMIVHGGLVMSSDDMPVTDADVWMFFFDSRIWFKKMASVVDLAGHTMTLVSSSEVIIVGGYSVSKDWNNRTFTYNFANNVFEANGMATGAAPAGLMMHTAVYHASSEALYIHGGYRYYIDFHYASNETFFYNVTSHRWYKRSDNDGTQTSSRYLHSAVQVDDRMLVLGGLIAPHDYDQSMFLYSYACDSWHGIGTLPSPMSGHSSLLNDSTVYIFSSSYSAVSIDALVLPDDICTMYSGSNSESCLSQRGCHACNENGSFHCFDSRLSIPAPCSGVNASELVLENSDTCDVSVIVSGRNCKAHKDCTQCLTAWPYHGASEQKCKWCSFCNVGMCIKQEQVCAEENECQRTQSERLTAEMCVEQRCRSGTCEQCQSEAQDKEGCIWTRQFMRSSEVGRQVSAIPFGNWNCVTKVLLTLSAIPVWSAPPYACPDPCQALTTCEQCLQSDGGGAGSSSTCYWSSRLDMCMPPSALPLLCADGTCAPLVESGDIDQCPMPCSDYTQCGQCLAQPHCGWCSQGDESDGLGLCMEGLSSGPLGGICAGNRSLQIEGTANTTSNLTYVMHAWNYLVCPLENECNNTHHTCDMEKEDCIDLTLGHHCICKDGYKLIEGVCIPQCNSGCVQGVCVKPDRCDCHFSWVGHNCSIPCECNQHSECLGPEATDTCTGCLNNTIGEQCEMCKRLSVGNSTNGGPCEDCFTVCNNHADVCMENATKQRIILQPNQSLTDAYLDLVSHGPLSHKDVICIDCKNNTTGAKCSHCHTGYFRRASDPTSACTKCMCNGHSFSCDRTTGINCQCSNNTKTTCQGDNSCYQQQCNQCVDSHVGTPVNEHQCYLKLSTDEYHCISRDATPSGTVCANAEPLPSGQAVMYAVLPRFLNVDIKIYINIDYGEVDIYIGKTEDLFLIKWDETLLQHSVEIDPKYTVIKERLRRDATSRSKRAVSNETLTYYWIEPEINGDAISSYIDAKSHDDGIYDALYYIKGVRQRVVINLPEVYHELRKDKFYVVLVARSSPGAAGHVLFRQDQVRIELFVFFAVFFSCFFKFLSICVIVWKMKSLYQQQQQRIQRAVELDQMASRPFASLLIQFDDREMELPQPLKSRKNDFQVNPASYEFTDDGVAVVGTVLFEMPGGKEVPARAMFGSSLMTLRVLYPNRKTITERHKDAERLKTTQT